jgi:hypothetical protein
MMDLITKLRTKDFNAKKTCVEAADEIDRLKKALASQTTLVEKQYTMIARLQAKVATTQ